MVESSIAINFPSARFGATQPLIIADLNVDARLFGGAYPLTNRVHDPPNEADQSDEVMYTRNRSPKPERCTPVLHLHEHDLTLKR
jgi:hypothetical protein